MRLSPGFDGETWWDWRGPIFISDRLHRPVQVAVIAMRMMERTFNHVIGMITVRDRFVSAIRTVDVARAFGRLRALHGVRGADFDDMLVDMISVDVVQMTVMKIIDMAVVPNGFVSAMRAMLVGMIAMVIGGTTGHGSLSFVHRLAIECGASRRPTVIDRDGIAGWEGLLQRFIEKPIDMGGARSRVGLLLSISGFH